MVEEKVKLPPGWRIKETGVFKPSISFGGSQRPRINLTPEPGLNEKPEKPEKPKKIYEMFSEKDDDAIKAMANVSSQIEEVDSMVDKLTPGWREGITRKLRMKSEYLKDPQLTALDSGFGLLTSTLLKQFQGSRPSDFDYKIWEVISGKGAVTPENMKAALNYVRLYVIKDKLSSIRYWSKKYALPETELWNIVGDNPSALQRELQILRMGGIKQKAKYITLPDGTRFPISGRE